MNPARVWRETHKAAKTRLVSPLKTLTENFSWETQLHKSQSD